jgi:hypothetical protein
VVRHIFQACPVWIYTQSNITSIIWHNNRYPIYSMNSITIYSLRKTYILICFLYIYMALYGKCSKPSILSLLGLSLIGERISQQAKYCPIDRGSEVHTI